jgi:superfamily II DNA or RNA helicase
MSQVVQVFKKDETNIRILTNSGIESELSDFFAFRAHGFQYHPAYRSRMWDGFTRLYNRKTKELFIGLVPYLEQFCKEREYELLLDDKLNHKSKFIKQEFDQFIESLKLPYTLRDYQENILRECIENNFRALIVSPTGSGKSACLYCLIRYGLEKFNHKKILLLVPTVNLVSQMESDFLDYSQNDPSFSENNIHKIYQGQDRDSDKEVLISTWQSLQKLDKRFFEKFDMVVTDECHLAKADSLKKIVSLCTNAKHKIGTTGTLDNIKVHKLVLEGLFGAQFRATTTEKLMGRGDLAQLKINCILLKYSDEECKATKGIKYADEINWILGHKKRNALLLKLALRLKGNTFIAIKHITHGKLLYEALQKVVKDRNIYFIDGSTKAEIREETRHAIESDTNAIIVASLGVFAMGINIKNLENIIFTTPSKSRIRVLQSIGRVLRIGDSNQATLYDIADDLCWKKTHKNFSYKHFLERLNIYIEEKFDYKFYKKNLE